MRFQICEADQKLFGAAELLEFDIRAISINDLDELATRFGFDPDAWPDPFIGELTLDQAGVPDAQPKPPTWQIRSMVWMALRQNGITVSWEDAGQARPLLWKRLPDPDGVPRGKEPTEDQTSAPSGASTTRRSSTSSGSRRRKST